MYSGSSKRLVGLIAFGFGDGSLPGRISDGYIHVVRFSPAGSAIFKVR